MWMDLVRAGVDRAKIHAQFHAYLLELWRQLQEDQRFIPIRKWAVGIRKVRDFRPRHVPCAWRTTCCCSQSKGRPCSPLNSMRAHEEPVHGDGQGLEATCGACRLLVSNVQRVLALVDTGTNRVYAVAWEYREASGAC